MEGRTPHNSAEEEWIQVVNVSRNTVNQIYPEFHGTVRFKDGTETRFVSDDELKAGSDYRVIYEYTEGPFGSPIVSMRNILEER